VDWVNACVGPAGVDVAHCRLNLAMMHGVAEANEFLDAYIDTAGHYHHDPFWDIDAALGSNLQAGYAPWQTFGLPAIAPAQLHGRLRSFLMDAVQR
jgi:uncharacterized protein involved in copper resistance